MAGTAAALLHNKEGFKVIFVFSFNVNTIPGPDYIFDHGKVQVLE